MAKPNFYDGAWIRYVESQGAVAQNPTTPNSQLVTFRVEDVVAYRDDGAGTVSIPASGTGDYAGYLGPYRIVETAPLWPGDGNSADWLRRYFDNQRKGESTMRGLFEVFIVDPRADAGDPDVDPVVSYQTVVALDEAGAKLKAAMHAVGALERDPESYDFIARRVGPVRETSTPVAPAK